MLWFYTDENIISMAKKILYFPNKRDSNKTINHYCVQCVFYYLYLKFAVQVLSLKVPYFTNLLLHKQGKLLCRCAK